MERKVLVCMVSVLVLIFCSTVQAQDPCQKFHDRYRVCVEKQDAGKTMDYDICKTLTDQSSCEGGGCYWNTMKAKCTIDLCLTDSTYEDGYVNVSDLGIYKNEYGRIDCPTTPLSQGPTEEELEARIISLETQLAQVTALLANVTRDGNDITFSGVNVHIVSGSGATNGPVNGLGNLIVGYNELRGSGEDNRTGSHNIVVGSFNNYISFGGLVAGSANTISGQYASVSGGVYNTASGNYASVSGGWVNTASGGVSSVSGGSYNTASDEVASISGGEHNTASGYYSSVSGGSYNEAAGDYASVSGGYYNRTGGRYTCVSGGSYNYAFGWYSIVSGGYQNQAMGEYSFIGGGGSSNPAYANYAVGDYSAILGGTNNIAGDPDRVDTAIGLYSSISGGRDNTASGDYASISGGRLGNATADDASVSGGLQNTASGIRSSVSGGENNTASGWAASVSGGSSHSATGTDDWIAGELFQDN